MNSAARNNPHFDQSGKPLGADHDEVKPGRERVAVRVSDKNAHSARVIGPTHHVSSGRQGNAFIALATARCHIGTMANVPVKDYLVVTQSKAP